MNHTSFPQVDIEQLDWISIDENNKTYITMEQVTLNKETYDRLMDIELANNQEIDRLKDIIEEFQKDQTFAKQQAELDVLKAYLNELTPDLKNGIGVIFSLSAAELRIAAMIRNGLTSPQIAGTLHISLDTVKTHRKNIRKKLKLSNSQVNLATYLRAKMG